MERRDLAEASRIAAMTDEATAVTLISLQASGEVAEWPKALAC